MKISTIRVTKKFFILLAVIGLSTLSLFAGQPEEFAEKIFNYMRQGRGDSISLYVQEDLRPQMPPAMFGQVFSQLEMQMGTYQSKSDWRVENVQGMTVVTADIIFKKTGLLFLLSTNEKGEINGIHFMPLPAVSVKEENEHDIVIRSGDYELPGILKLPDGEGPFPVAVLVHGSGPHDRNETIGPNQVFLDMANLLAQQGIATIRYDKRTFVYGAQWEKEGKGTFDEETTDDAVAAVWLATTLPELSSVYVIGHSQGAIMAPRIAQKAGDVRGIVMMAGTPRPLHHLIAEQFEYLHSHQQPGLTQELVDLTKAQAANLDLYGTEGYDPSLGVPMGIGSEAYWKFVLKYNALETLRSLSVPALILQGERDYQVTMKDYALWQQGVADRPNVKLKSYPGLNHIFSEGEGLCLPAEYEKKMSIAPYVIEDIASFIHNRK